MNLTCPIDCKHFLLAADDDPCRRCIRNEDVEDNYEKKKRLLNEIG